MRIALDTNRYVDLCKGLAATIALLEAADEVQHNLVLHARDRHFDHLPQLTLV